MNYRRFSEREGFIKVSDEIQVDFMTDDLRNSLWNTIFAQYYNRSPDFNSVFVSMWINLFKN